METETATGRGEVRGRWRAVVARGHGGHRTGWIASRLAVRALLAECPEPVFGGAADRLPTEWGWPGSLRDAEDARWVFDQVFALYAPVGELVADFDAVDAAARRISELPLRLTGPVASCTALELADGVATVVHIGRGGAFRVRSGEVRALTEEHTAEGLARALARGDPDAARRFGLGEIALPSEVTLPPNVLLRALGGTPAGPHDVVRIDLGPDEEIVLCSGSFEGASPEEVVRVPRDPKRN